MALRTPLLSAFCVLQGAILTTMLATRNFSGRCCLWVSPLRAELGGGEGGGSYSGAETAAVCSGEVVIWRPPSWRCL